MEQPRVVRFIWFGVSIAIGIALSLIIGWTLPSLARNTAGPESLRQDYEIDYLLMVAEIYDQKGDINYANEQIDVLGDDVNLRHIQQSILTARDIGHDGRDLDLMAKLSQKILSTTPQDSGGEK